MAPRVITAIKRHYPGIDVLRVGDDGAPPLGTLDPDILRYLEVSERILVTDNRASMPGHLDEHFAAGGRHSGIFIISKDAPLGALIDELNLFWEASEARRVDR